MVIYVVGLGSMGKRRTRLLLEREGIEVIGIDSREDRREEASKLHGIRAFASIEEAKAYKKGDCAFVCTAPISHANVIETCLKNDLSIFTELNLVDDKYEENVALAKEKGLTLFLSSTFLYRAEINYITDRVRESEKAVNYVYHAGQYLPDWHPWENFKDFFVGNKRTNGCREFFAIEMPWIVSCFGEIESISVVKGNMSSLKVDFPDYYMVQICHKNGTKGMFTVDVVSRKPTRHLEVFSEDMFLTWDGTPTSLYTYDIEKKENVAVDMGAYEHDSRYAAFVVENQYRVEMDDFFETLSNPLHTPRWSFAQDKVVLDLIDRIEA